MQVWLFRRRLSLLSGAGQLVRMQAEGLERAGVSPVLAAESKRLKFFLRSRRRVRSLDVAGARQLAASGRVLFVDHSALIPEADIVFVHNHFGAMSQYMPVAASDPGLRDEAEFFSKLGQDARLVANSFLVREAMVAHHGLDAERIAVLHPGFDARRFGPATRDRLRPTARRQLGLGDDSFLVGFVSSGNLAKRGFGCLLEVARLLAHEDSRVKFLVVGSSRLPEDERIAELLRSGRLIYRRRSGSPERWFAALDLFLYPAVWEEFGMVVLEAMACGLPVLTSRRVGAIECLPALCQDLVLDAPDAAQFAEATMRLMNDAVSRSRMAEASIVASRSLDDRRFGDRAAALILDQNR